MLISAILGWGVCCAFYALAAWIAFPGPLWLVARLAGWQWFYSAWHAVAYSIVLFSLLALFPIARRSLFERSGFILVGLLGGIITWPLGVVLWSLCLYGDVYFPWLRPNLPEDLSFACILGLSVIAFYGLCAGYYVTRSNV